MGKRQMSKRKISEKYEKIIERAAATKHKAMQDEKAAKQKETKNKGKSLEKATEFIVEKFHKDHEIGTVRASEMNECIQSKFVKEKEWIEEDIELIFDSLEKLKIIKKILVKDQTGNYCDRFS